jgi:phenylalanine ammonia-lyase
VRDVVGQPPNAEKSYIWNDNDQSLDIHIAMIAADIAREGRIVQAVNPILSSLK